MRFAALPSRLRGRSRFGSHTVVMVESMEHTQDVERLFSWLKAPMVHYREFAPQLEVAEAVATWPAAHKAAVQTGLAPDTESGPHGDAAARERQARDRRFMPPAAAQAIHDSPMPGTEPPPTPGRLADVLTAEISAEIAGGFTPESASEPGEPENIRIRRAGACCPPGTRPTGGRHGPPRPVHRRI